MSGETNRRTNHGDGYSDCWLCGLFVGVGMIANQREDYYQSLFLNNEALKEEIKVLQRKASAWDRVVSIANDGVGLKASEIKAIEEQMVTRKIILPLSGINDNKECE